MYHTAQHAQQAPCLSGLSPSSLLVISAILLALSHGQAHAGESPQFIAGLQPDRRPAAPKIKEVERNAQWYARAFTGIAQPYPWSLRFVNEQGNWHTPFARPGMTGLYDIRGWHRQPVEQRDVPKR